MFSVIAAALSISIDWGGDIMGGIICSVLNISNENKQNFQYALIYKIVMLIGIMALTRILPLNSEI